MKGIAIARLVAVAAKRAARRVAEFAHATSQCVLTRKLTRRWRRRLRRRWRLDGRRRRRWVFCASKSRQRDECKSDAEKAHER
jgi:antitoxin (DNA-binding transcriptional repressor) of toxin-antitoxin stability system